MTYYTFLRRRPCDCQAWPCIFTDMQLAQEAAWRVSAVVQVELTEDGVDERREGE